MMTASSRRELYKLRELIHFLLMGAGGSKRRARNNELICYFCIQPFNYAADFIKHGNSIGPKFTEQISIHHIDGNHENNEEQNKAACHTKCHKSYHRSLSNAARAAKETV